MYKKPLIIIGCLALAGWGVSALMHSDDTVDDTMDQAGLEQELKDQGVVNANGTVSVDKDFDPELNALISEMNQADKDAQADLDALQ